MNVNHSCCWNKNNGQCCLQFALICPAVALNHPKSEYKESSRPADKSPDSFLHSAEETQTNHQQAKALNLLTASLQSNTADHCGSSAFVDVPKSWLALHADSGCAGSTKTWHSNTRLKLWLVLPSSYCTLTCVLAHECDIKHI